LTYHNPIFGKITYPLEEAIFLLCAYHFDEFYGEIKAFFSKVYSGDLFYELLEYQKSIIVLPNINEKEYSFNHDFYRYFSEALSGNHVQLTKIECRYRYSCQIKTYNWDEYSRYVIWYGRRNGRTLFTNKPNTIEEIN
ncbi:MAG: hypothetical protein ACI4SB_07225, partial [Acutalibacteraceae bacterium]